MTKEEFSNIINVELEKIQIEINKAQKKYTFIREYPGGMDPLFDDELKQTEYQMNLLYERVHLLKRLVNFPAYARVQAMSDLEMEEYKKEKEAELDLQIKEIKDREAQERLDLENLKKEKDYYISNLDKMFGSERERAIARAREIQGELIDYNPNYDQNMFIRIESELKFAQEQKKGLIEKSFQQIKDEICSSIKNGNQFKHILDNIFIYGIIPSKRLYASVANDPEKAYEMANLIEQYSKIMSKKQVFTSFNVEVSENSPRALIDSLVNPYSFGSYKDFQIKVNADNIESVEKAILEAEAKFIFEKERLSQEYTYEKLKNFSLYGETTDEVDSDFINLHSNKIKKENVDSLQTLIEKKNILLKKLFKTRAVKDELLFIDANISGTKSLIYSSVECWYQTQCYEVIGSNKKFHYYGSWNSREERESIKEDIERFYKEISITEHQFNTLKANLQKARINIESENIKREEEKGRIANKIRELAGPEFKKAEIPVDDMIKLNDMKHIVDASVEVKQDDIIKEVQEEAKNQADTREEEIVAKINGISIDDLQRLKLLFNKIKEEMSRKLNEPNNNQETMSNEFQIPVVEQSLINFEFVGLLEEPKEKIVEEPEEGKKI